jgi:hypothetical protein
MTKVELLAAIADAPDDTLIFVMGRDAIATSDDLVVQFERAEVSPEGQDAVLIQVMNARLDGDTD